MIVRPARSALNSAIATEISSPVPRPSLRVIDRTSQSPMNSRASAGRMKSNARKSATTRSAGVTMP